MMQRWTHRLEGLEPDNFLAFMALLGLLRALETARPDWCPRAAWDLDTQPWRPVLSLRANVSREELAAASAQGCGSYARLCRPLFETALQKLVEFDIEALRKFDEENAGKELDKKKKKERDKIERRSKRTDPAALVDLAREPNTWRELFDVGNREARAAISPWCGEFFDKRGISVKSSPLKLVAGQMRFVGTALKLSEEACDADLFNSLFKAWEFRHRGDSFRFAHQEVRQYAYLASDPSQQEKRPQKRKGSNEPPITGDGVAPSEKGANTLAALAFESFQPLFDGRILAVPGMGKTEKRSISWPIVALDFNKVGLALAGLQSIIFRGTNSKDREHLWMIAKIIEPEQDYLNLTPGTLLTPPGP